MIEPIQVSVDANDEWWLERVPEQAQFDPLLISALEGEFLYFIPDDEVLVINAVNGTARYKVTDRTATLLSWEPSS